MDPFDLKWLDSVISPGLTMVQFQKIWLLKYFFNSPKYSFIIGLHFAIKKFKNTSYGVEIKLFYIIGERI